MDIIDLSNVKIRIKPKDDVPDWASAPSTDQGSEAWLRWRSKGLGASDGPILMGESPWKTPYQLWLEKTNQASPSIAGFAAERGHYLEPFARTKYEEVTKKKAPAKTFERGDYMRASMDGWVNEQNSGVEIKCPMNRKDHDEASKGKVPDKYKWQLVHQLYVTGATFIDYFSYFVEANGKSEEGAWAIVRWFPNEVHQQEYLKRAHEFWMHIQDKTEPPLTDKDYRIVKNQVLREFAQEFLLLKDEADSVKIKMEIVKQNIINLSEKHEWGRFKAYGIKLSKISPKGSINYDNVDELKGVNLEKYRKKQKAPYYKLEVDRGAKQET